MSSAKTFKCDYTHNIKPMMTYRVLFQIHVGCPTVRLMCDRKLYEISTGTSKVRRLVIRVTCMVHEEAWIFS